MMRHLILALAVSAFTFAIACDKKSNPPATPEKTIPEPPPAKKSTPAPKGVPQVLKDMVDSKWPAIEEAGDAFIVAFDKATKAKEAGDRDLMDTSVEAASTAYKKAMDMWIEIAYWPTNELEDQKQIDRCERFLSKWEKRTKVWQKKAKGLAQFQRIGK